MPTYDVPVPYSDPVTLAGDLVRLSPLGRADHDDLVLAVRDGELWSLSVTSVPTPEHMAAEIGRHLGEHATGQRLPFTVRRADTGEVIGTTSYLNISEVHKRLEIGSTWLAASAQRTGINAECKLLLLTHAFDTLGCNVVEFRTHWLNRTSRAAIELLGAKLDGILRAHMVMPDGSLRDTAAYSIVASEWPAVRAELRRRLARPAGGGMR